MFINCKLIVGAKGAIFLDLQTQKFSWHNKEDIDENLFSNQNLLIDNISNLKPVEVSEINQIDTFLDFEIPSIITNVILEFNESLVDIYKQKIKEFEQLCCKVLHIAISKFDLILNLSDILKEVNESAIESLTLLIKYEVYEKIEKKVWISISQMTIISKIIIFDVDLELENKLEIIPKSLFVKDNWDSHITCGIVEPFYFSPNIPHFAESQHHNTCLNRKIAIDAEGNIKNCPSMAKSYGNIKDTKLIDVVNNPDFQKVWHIKKDEITKCKDCEFRHICTDCRAYIENPEDQFSAPLKCGYNPYTCEWEEWSTNPLKQKAIEYYGMQELVKK